MRNGKAKKNEANTREGIPLSLTMIDGHSEARLSSISIKRHCSVMHPTGDLPPESAYISKCEFKSIIISIQSRRKSTLLPFEVCIILYVLRVLGDVWARWAVHDVGLLWYLKINKHRQPSSMGKWYMADTMVLLQLLIHHESLPGIVLMKCCLVYSPRSFW